MPNVLKRTPQQFVEELKIKNPTVIPLENYKGAKIKIRFKCIDCGYEWITSPDSVLRGSKCRKCNGTAPLTTEEFEKELFDIHPNLKISGEYSNRNTKVAVKCLECEYEWEASPASLISNKYNSNGCPNCYGNVKKTMDDLLNYLQINFPEIVPIENSFENVKSKMNFQCNVCGYIWESSVGTAFSWKAGCKKCFGNANKNTADFIEEVKQLNSDIEVISEYINALTNVKLHCKKCGEVWEQTPHKLLHNIPLCPNCNLSAGETVIKLFLQKNNVVFKQQYTYSDCVDKNKLPFDFYLPEYNMLIEYQGKQHYQLAYFGNYDKKQAEENLKTQQNHDKIKSDYCKSNNIKLLVIPFWEFNNIGNILERELK